MSQSSANTPVTLVTGPQTHPAWHMAADRALLEAQQAGELCGTTVRFYRWDPAAVSLGRLQEPNQALELERLAEAGVPVVRRATGGKAVYHADELTYSVVGTIGAPEWGESLHTTYGAVSALIQAGLRRLGITTGFAPGRPSAAQLGAALGDACFGVAYGHELVHGGRKICGSAQRRLVRAFLQHGSLPLSSRHTDLVDYLRCPEAARPRLRAELQERTTDVEAALGRPVSFQTALAAMVAELTENFGPRLEPGTLPEAVLRRIPQLLREVTVSVAPVA